MELFQSETGEKTQATHVDREDGNPAGSGKARGGEHRAVTPEHEEKLRCVGHALTRQTLRTIRQTLSCLFVNESLNATRAEPFQQWRNNDDEIRAARTRKSARAFAMVTAGAMTLQTEMKETSITTKSTLSGMSSLCSSRALRPMAVT